MVCGCYGCVYGVYSQRAFPSASSPGTPSSTLSTPSSPSTLGTPGPLGVSPSPSPIPLGMVRSVSPANLGSAHLSRFIMKIPAYAFQRFDDVNMVNRANHGLAFMQRGKPNSKNCYLVNALCSAVL